MLIVGIDPGFSGAIAALDLSSGELDVLDMPLFKDPKGNIVLNQHELYRILTLGHFGSVTVYIEKVAAMPKQGVSSTFRFGECFGALQMAVVAQGFPLNFVTPAKWKGHFKLNADKGLSRGLASRRFPKASHLFSRVKDDGRAEAALIALYGAETGIRTNQHTG